jgi:DNA invertase Pin-like site-specific DNA recombinase
VAIVFGVVTKLDRAARSVGLRRERQLEGIAKAKKAGVYKGRPPSSDADAVRRLKADGLGATEIARRLSIGRASVHRILSANS